MNRVAIIYLALILYSCSKEAPPLDSPQEGGPWKTVVPFSQVQWQKLNPARGDKSPQAGTLWGDRNEQVPTGFLAKFVDGFSSPPHLHNVTYRAVVISGLLHNDDPNAANMWMPTGSFWTQPKGEVHITSAKGKVNIALVEIDQGPYLVRPKNDAFDSGERPINVHARNIVWMPPPEIRTTPGKKAPRVAYLWGDPSSSRSNGSLLRLPGNFTGEIKASESTFRAVIIQGTLDLGRERMRLLPGSYFGSSGKESFPIACGPERPTIIYVRTKGQFRITPK